MTAPSLNMDALVSAFTAPMYALPIDMFRVLAGLVSLWYFARTLRSDRMASVPFFDRAAVTRLLDRAQTMDTVARAPLDSLLMVSSSNLVGLILASSGSIPTQARRRGEEQRPMEINHWR